MSNAYIHAKTLHQLETLVKDLPQSVLVSGPVGIGLKATVTYIADTLKVKPVYVLPEKDEKVDLEKGVITVDVIRRLYATTKTVETGKRLIVIDYAERMSTQSQNAFLKLLEEPGINTHFILLTHSVAKALPTILSRVQIIDVQPISVDQSSSLLEDLKVTDAQKRAQLLFIAEGLPALMTRLAADDKAFESRVQIVRDARTYLQGSTYDRLKIALAYKDSREDALTVLSDAGKLLKGSIKNGQAKDVLRKIDAVLSAHERIEANGNIRLQLASVMF